MVLSQLIGSVAFLSLVFPVQCVTYASTSSSTTSTQASSSRTTSSTATSVQSSSVTTTSSSTTSVQASTIPTLSPECIAVIGSGQPTPATWQTCQTSKWLQQFVDQEAIFRNLTALAIIGGFSRAIGSLTDMNMACTFGRRCQLIPTWPMADTSNATNVQATMVLLSLNFLNDWYTASVAQLGFTPTLIQNYGSNIFDHLTPSGSTADAQSVSEGAVFNLLGTVLSIVPNPFAKSAVGALKFLGLLFQPPASSPTAPLIALTELQSMLSPSDGRLYASAYNSLLTRWQTLFRSGTYPKASNGILAVLANGAWFDFDQNQRLTSTAVAQQVEFLTYEWLVSQSLQSYRVFIHAVAVDDSSSRALYDMPGESLVVFESYTFNVWPAVWNPSPNILSPRGLTQYSPGSVLYTPLVANNSIAINASDLFTQSLLCQLQQKVFTTECDMNGANCQLSNDSTMLNPWPSPSTSAIYSQTPGACLFNLPIVLDNSQSNLPNFHFPEDLGTMSRIASANEECPTGGLWADWRDPMSNGVVVFIGNQLGVCQTQWS